MASILSRAGGYLRSHPIGFWFIFWGELAERCSYYGMRAILALYMTEKLGFSETSASRVMAYFIAACYFLPLVGGWVADNVLGKYWTIVGFSVPYILGHVILGVETTTFLYIALALLAMGSGVIKPNISTLMGMTYDQERPGQEQMRSDAFAMFYGAVNIGAAMSSMAMPIIRNRYDYATAFLFPAGLMVLAFGFFAAGKRFYAREEIEHRESTPEERAAKFELLMRLGAIFATVTFFWCIFDQSPSTWTFFAKSHLDLNLFGYQLAPDQLQSLNPLFIVTLLPLVTIGWRVLAMAGLPLKPTSKMLVGFVLTGVCMAIMSAAGFLAADGRVSVLWEVVAYLLITVAEICISVVGLELSFAAAPKAMKSFISACWLLPIFIGNLLNAQLVKLYEAYDPGAYFGLMALMMIPVTIAFIFAARAFNRHEPPREITGEPAPEDEAARAF